MTITFHKGDLISERVDAIVNTVNVVGVMGKGIALQFRRKWPENYQKYVAACNRGDVKIGKMFVVDNGRLVQPHFIINFPTKKHWRQPSRLEYIRDGLVDLVSVIKELEIGSIALPPLGCGNGGLAWAEVCPLIEEAFRQVPGVEARVFPPSPNNQFRALAPEKKPARMTAGRAAMVAVLAMYQRLNYALTMIETQKLAYFLNFAGEPLNLTFKRHNLGPYCPDLKHVLVKMDGAYITGVGDLSKPSEIQVLPSALADAQSFLKGIESSDTVARVDRLSRLIEGFETPLGMELLATTHWAAIQTDGSLSQVTEYVHSWNARKQQLMSQRMIERAYGRLVAEKWVEPPAA